MHDLAIVGSGFGGSLTALVARRLGLDVILLEHGAHNQLVPPRKRDNEIEAGTTTRAGHLNGPRRQHLDQSVVPDDEHGKPIPGMHRFRRHCPQTVESAIA
jgi:choline dehydrogenase-like flavoprotein